ncbi:MAG: hypothetical protein WD491_14475 [Balneolales bacterium]
MAKSASDNDADQQIIITVSKGLKLLRQQTGTKGKIKLKLAYVASGYSQKILSFN